MVTRRRVRRVGMLVRLFAIVVLMLATGTHALASPNPAPPPQPYSCPATADLETALGPNRSVDDFLGLWVPRLTGAVPVLAGLPQGGLPGIGQLDEVLDQVSLDEYLNRTSLPQAIADEGYHSLELSLRQCLISKLYAELDAPGGVDDPAFPAPGIAHDTALALLYGFVFDNQWIHDFKESVAPGDQTVIENPIPVDSVDALLASLSVPAVPPLPKINVPDGLKPVTLVSRTADQLTAGLLNPVNKLFTDLGSVTGGIAVPVKLPPIDLPSVDIGGVISLLRRVIDSTMYQLCWTSEKVTVRKCTLLDVPLGTPVSIDLAGDSRPDVVAQLTPLIDTSNPTNSVQMRWTVTRLPNLTTGYSGPLRAHVFSIFTIPTGDLLLSVGSSGVRSTLANRSEYTFTLTDVRKATEGDVNINIRLLHEAPGSTSAVTYGVAPLDRNPNNLGEASARSYDVGLLHFTPVPASPRAINAALTIKSADFDQDGSDDQRIGINLTMPQPNVVLDAAVLSKLPPAPPPQGQQAECCPFRDIRALVNAIPQTANVVVDSYPALRTTDVTYNADQTIGRIDFSSTSFPDTDAEDVNVVDGNAFDTNGHYPTGADRNTFTKVSSVVLDLPRRAHVRIQSPDPDASAKTTVAHYDADAPIPHLEFTSEEFAHDAVANAAALQRRLHFRADNIPTLIDLTNTTTAVTDRHSTGSLLYSSNGSVTNVHAEISDRVNVSELVADIASLPPTIVSTYDVESPADLEPIKPGCEDAGHTILHVDGRSAANAEPGSAPFGQLTARFRSKVDAFLTPDLSIAPVEHAIVNADPRSATTCLDDTLQADLRYSGLRYLDANILESGEISALIRNDAEKKFVIQVSQPDQQMTTTIENLPRQTTFSKLPVGNSADHSKIVYDGCTPAAQSCLPKSIASLKVRLDGVGTSGKFKTGEFVDVTATSVPNHVEVDLDLPEADGSTKTVAFDGAAKTGRVTAAVRKSIPDLGTLSLAADVGGIPKHFDVSFGKQKPIVFRAGEGQVIDSIKAALTNTGTAQAPETFSPHAYVKYIEAATGNPQLEASLGLANLGSFRFEPGGDDGSFTGTIKTALPPSGPNPNALFTLNADVLTLAAKKDANGNEVKDANGNSVLDPDLNKATVIKTASGGATLKPLPTSIVISKTGGEQATGLDTSTLTIDTMGATGLFAINADIAIGGPDGVADALGETLEPVQGVSVGDGAATGEKNAIRLRLLLDETPSKAVVRYGQILFKQANLPANPDPSFDIGGFGNLPGGLLNILINLNSTPADDRLTATVGIRGVAPALGFVKFFPITLRPNATTPGDKDDLDLDIRYQAGGQGGPFDLDLRLGEEGSPARVKQRVVVHTDGLPPQVLFKARMGKAVAPDLLNFQAEFKDSGGGLTGSPGHTTVTYQTPGPRLDGTSNPQAKVTLDLHDVPSYLDFTVKTAASTKPGNPDETCGLVESDFVLPTIVYNSDGANRNNLDLAGQLDLSFIDPDKPPPPLVIFDIVDLADGFTITNTDEGKTYNLENPDETTGKVLVKVKPLEVTLLDINWTGCEEPTGLVGWKASGRAKVAINTELRLQIENLVDVELKPGFSTGVSGSYGKLTLGLPGPQFTVTFSEGFKGGLQLRLSDDIKGTIPVLAAPDGTKSFPLPIVFHVANSEPGPWLSFMSPIPCVVPGFQLTVTANIEPHRTKLELNQFTVDGGTWVVTADPFGASSGLSILFGGLDIIDTIAGLFTSPYPHGIREPSLSCEFVL